MSSTIDISTRLLHRAIDVLSVGHPERTWLGVVLGGALAAASRVCGSIVKLHTNMDPQAVGNIGYGCIGILVLQMPTLLYFATHRPIGPEDIDQLFTAIDRSNLTATEKRQQYRILLRAVIERVAIQQALKSQTLAAKASARKSRKKTEKGPKST